MDNQHRYINGYRELDKSEIDLMNEIKNIANEVGNTLEAIQAKADNIDHEWMELAKKTLQTGFMQATRSIAKPTFF